MMTVKIACIHEYINHWLKNKKGDFLCFLQECLNESEIPAFCRIQESDLWCLKILGLP